MAKQPPATKRKDRIFELIEADIAGVLSSKAIDVAIMVLIAINVVLIILETFTVSAAWQRIFDGVLTASIIIFTVEITLRIYTADLLPKYRRLPPWKARLKYLISPMSLIDLIAVVPFYISFLPLDLRIVRTLRVARVFKIFKYHRYTSSFDIIRKVCLDRLHQLLVSTLLLLMVIVIASVLIYHLEHAAQPDGFSSAFSALWWIVASLTNIGPGEIYPITIGGRLLSLLISMLGIGLIAVPTGIISAGFIEHTDKRRRARRRANFCPQCGFELNPPTDPG